jgi:DNA-binding CsgD family transcriptional regulator
MRSCASSAAAGRRRRVAELAAVIGARADHDVLRQVSDLAAAAFVEAVEELERHRILDETAGETGAPAYDFTHPLLQSTIYADLGAARVRLLHAKVADALERVHRSAIAAHADELAFHFSRADAADATPKAARYMAMAGRRALQRHATSEARRYLEAALELSDGSDAAALDAPSLAALVEDLARARQRSGDYDGARSLWERALADAAAAGDDTKRAAIERRLGLARYWGGRHDDALAHYDRALAAAERAANDELVARVRIARGMALQELGRPGDAQQEVRLALAAAERVGSPGMLARAHRALLLLHVFTGPAEVAAEHGRRSIALAAESGDRGVEWSAHWGMAVLAGFTGDAGAVARHAEASARLTDELRSPVLRAWTDEVLVEYAAGVGDWDAGLALAGRTIAVARALGQRTLLPRLLVWTGLMRLWRGEMDEARALFEESWTISGAGRERRTGVDVHTVVPAHTGMAAYHVALGEYARAIEVGEAGVEIADRSGYVSWAIHRLLPTVIEASLWAQDFARAERHGARLRRDSERLGHRLGLAWATACDALVARLRDGDAARAVALMRDAADALDAVPFPFDAARLRRNLAQLLIADGDRDAAMRELRQAHDVFARLGAERELRGARDQLRAIGSRPPSRAVSAAGGSGTLTEREREIAHLVAARKSNRDIGTILGISARTVSTHLSNIFAKLEVESRGELTDLVRDGGV